MHVAQIDGQVWKEFASFRDGVNGADRGSEIVTFARIAWEIRALRNTRKSCNNVRALESGFVRSAVIFPQFSL